MQWLIEKRGAHKWLLQDGIGRDSQSTKPLRTGRSTSSYACLKVWCRRISWPWSVQPRSTPDVRLSLRQVLCPTTVWPRQTSFPCRCLFILCGRFSGRSQIYRRLTGKLGRLLLNTEEGTPVARMQCFTYRERRRFKAGREGGRGYGLWQTSMFGRNEI